MPDLLKGNRALLADWNIIYQLIQTIRDPLLGVSLSKFNLMYTSLFTIVFSIMTILIYKKIRKKNLIYGSKMSHVVFENVSLRIPLFNKRLFSLKN